MHDSQRYRDIAAECLRAAQQAGQPHYRKLQLSMAVPWLSLARQDEAMDDLLASWDTAEPVTTDLVWGTARSMKLSVLPQTGPNDDADTNSSRGRAPEHGWRRGGHGGVPNRRRQT